ncbi:zinc finger C2HC domain-containing protein 1A isoform X2 [Hemitrygon akajei]|uniref:zinc finger C2HC domain-containing protein 1A isoform X2 n=1 Tax=Hemitrygon akajei TaxID=2704970 RepID=UPI003BF95749
MEGVLGEEGGKVESNLIPCRICGRTFLAAARLKHEPICQKNANKKRKTFDSSRQRAEGTDIPTLKPLKPRPEPPKKPSNWRQKHESFIATIRAAKKATLIIKEGGTPPPPPPPLYDPDYVQCPYCQRRFNENAAERHISFCKEQAARVTKPKHSSAKGKQSSLTQYKSPVLKKTNSPVSTPNASTRIPQPSLGKTVTVFSTTKSNLPSASENKLRDGSPVKRTPSGAGNISGAGSQPTSNIRSRTLTPPSGTRSTAAAGSVNRKTHNAENYVRNNIKSGLDTRDSSLTISDGNVKGNIRNSPGQQLPRFCHQCGTKYPVEGAKFCCECGMRRLML